MHEGRTTTIAELSDQGLIEFRKVDEFHAKRSVRTAYFADIKGTNSGWEIGKIAYESRVKGVVILG